VPPNLIGNNVTGLAQPHHINGLRIISMVLFETVCFCPAHLTRCRFLNHAVHLRAGRSHMREHPFWMFGTPCLLHSQVQRTTMGLDGSLTVVFVDTRIDMSCVPRIEPRTRLTFVQVPVSHMWMYVERIQRRLAQPAF